MRFIILFLLITLSSYNSSAQVTLPKVFTDHMVLQRGIDIPIWGKAKAGGEITVELGFTHASTKVDASGNWMVRLSRMEAGGPYNLQVYDTKNPKSAVVLSDVLIGDVWLASGQSNMELQVQQAKDAEIEAKQANYPQLRFFIVPHAKSVIPETDISKVSWVVCDSTSVKTVSAVAYYFARKIHTDIHVPIGILQATWGGTPVEAWTSREMLLSSTITCNKVLGNDTVTKMDFRKDSLDLIKFWDIVYNPKNNCAETVPQQVFDDSKWKEVEMPKTIKDWHIPFYEGMVWMRKSIIVPENFLGKTHILNLGHPEMNYSLYVNGKEICKTVWNANFTHQYILPAGLIKKGENMVTVRLAALWSGGGFNPPADEMFLSDGPDKISLAGNWKYKKDLEPAIPKILNFQYYPTYLFNAMIHPIIPYGIKGFIWYQGEANDSLAHDYRTLFPMMIADWRIRWQLGYLPFLYVQLPNYLKAMPEPSESKWAELREAQALTRAQPNTGMACTIELGEENNIHPLNKQEVGSRLALQALKVAYGQKIQASGPVFKNIRIEGKNIVISFSEIGSGLDTRDHQKLNGFSIAGSDGHFYWASARISGNEVVVSAQNVMIPVAVRYSWADNPNGNLVNVEGFPAIPFRTDKGK